MAQLSPKEKIDILNKRQEGKSIRTIAREMQVSKGTVQKYTQPEWVLGFLPIDKERVQIILTQHLIDSIELSKDITNLKKKLGVQIEEILNNFSSEELNQFVPILNTYIKNLNLAVNKLDKNIRTIAPFLPSKQISIDQYQDKKYILVKSNID